MQRIMKIGIVYTGTTPELIDDVNKQIHKVLGNNVELLTYGDVTILSDVITYGDVYSKPAAKLIRLYSQAIMDGAEAILNTCSSVGEIVDSMQSFADVAGVPIVRIDEEMCREAVIGYDNIAVMATLSSTLNPTVGTIRHMAKVCGKKINITEILVENAFGIEQNVFKEKMLEYAEKYAGESDIILLAQGSMSYCEEFLRDKLGKAVVSSPSFGARALKEALVKKGAVK